MSFYDNEKDINDDFCPLLEPREEALHLEVVLLVSSVPDLSPCQDFCVPDFYNLGKRSVCRGLKFGRSNLNPRVYLILDVTF